MKILDSSKSLSVLVSDSTNGLGTIQPLECTVTEELNGIYECEFTVLTTDKHYEDLKNSGLIKVTVGDGSEQIFRVYFISEPINFVVTIKAQHISYDLSKIVVKPFTATGAVNVKNQLVSHILGSYPFTAWTDITNTTSTFTLDIPRSFRECLGGYEGSVLDVFRCEYEWDNLMVKMYARRGADNGVRIAYGKNLTDFVQEQNNENVYDGVYGYAVVDEVTYEASNYYNKTGATTPKILNVDFSSDYETGQVPTAAELLQKATDYATNNSIEVPSVNIKIDFIPLWQTEEYKDILQLERVSLGDTVHVYFDKLNVEASARVIKTVWNVLTEKYDSIELGDAKANMNTVINSAVNTAVDDKIGNLDIDVGFIEDDLNDLGKLIINGLGLYFTREELATGGYRFYLHNQPTLADSDIQYYMSANGLMVSTDGGQTWNAGFNAQGEMILQALSTITLRALEIYGSFLRFGDVDSNYIDVAPYSDSNSNPLGVSFDGTGTVRFRPHGEFYVENKNLSDVLLNSFKMTGVSDATTPTVDLRNYSGTTGYMGNRLLMTSSSSESNLQIANRLNDVTRNLIDMKYTSSETYLALSNRDATGYRKNRIYFQITSTQTRTFLRNNKLSVDQIANQVNMYYNATDSRLHLDNYQFSANNYGNYLHMIATSAKNQVYLANYSRGTTYEANTIDLQSSSTGNNLYLKNNDTSGNNINRINLQSDGMITMYAGSDLRLDSGGAVRMTSSNGQDCTITSADDVNIQWSDKLYLNGNSMTFETITVGGNSYTVLAVI